MSSHIIEGSYAPCCSCLLPCTGVSQGRDCSRSFLTQCSVLSLGSGCFTESLSRNGKMLLSAEWLVLGNFSGL